MDSHRLYSPRRLNSKHTLSIKRYHMETRQITQTMQRLLIRTQSSLQNTMRSRVQTKIKRKIFLQLRASTKNMKIIQGQEKSNPDQSTNKTTVHTRKKRTIFLQMHFWNVTSPTKNKTCPTLQTNPISRSDPQCITRQNSTQKFYNKMSTRLPRNHWISKAFRVSFMGSQLRGKQCPQQQKKAQIRSTRWKRRTLHMKRSESLKRRPNHDLQHWITTKETILYPKDHLKRNQASWTCSNRTTKSWVNT